MPFRLDARQPLKWEKLSGSRYLAHAVLGKANHPLVYHYWSNGAWKSHTESVREDELFSDESLLTARAMPILKGHPAARKYNNNKEGLLIGHTFDSFVREDGQLIMPVVVDDIRGVEIIDRAIQSAKLAELSPGYSIRELERQDNIYYQIGRQYDHLALLDPGAGRGGQDIVLRTDELEDIAVVDRQYFDFGKVSNQDSALELAGADSDITAIPDPCPDKQGGKKLKVKLDGKEFEVEDAELAIAITGANTRLDTLTAERNTLTADKSKIEGELAGVKTRLDAAESSAPTEEAIATDIQERLDTWVVCLSDFRADKTDFQPDYKMSPAEIKRAWLKLKHPTINLDGKDALFVEGVWTGVKPTPKTDAEDAIDRTDALLDQLNKAPSKERNDEGEKTMDKVRAGYENAHKKSKAGANN